MALYPEKKPSTRLLRTVRSLGVRVCGAWCLWFVVWFRVMVEENDGLGAGWGGLKSPDQFGVDAPLAGLGMGGAWRWS